MSLQDQLTAIVGSSGVIAGTDLTTRFAGYFNGPIEAELLVRPTTTDEVSQVLALCNANNRKVVTQGGMTGLVRGTQTAPGDIILSLERMNRIEAIDDQGRTATVQSGVVLEALEQQLEDKGLLFPLDLGSRGTCQLGGNAATNAGGVRVLRHGMMRELTLGLEAVLADGTVISSMNELLKNNTGYDLKQLFIGSEGTLGVITRLVLRLKERPSTRNTALVAVDNVDQAARLLRHVDVGLAGQLSAYEVMWQNLYQHLSQQLDIHPMSDGYGLYVLIEMQGNDAAGDKDRFQTVLERALEQELILDAVVAQSETEANQLWHLRDHVDELAKLRPIFGFDVSLPIRHMSTYTEQLRDAISTRWPEGKIFIFGHMADGNLHIVISAGEQDEATHRAISECVYAPLAEFSGSISAEHGIGLEKRAYLNASRSEQEIALMRQLKGLLDPNNTLNPGKIFA